MTSNTPVVIPTPTPSAKVWSNPSIRAILLRHMDPASLAVTIGLCKEVMRDAITLLYKHCELNKLNHVLDKTKNVTRYRLYSDSVTELVTDSLGFSVATDKIASLVSRFRHLRAIHNTEEGTIHLERDDAGWVTAVHRSVYAEAMPDNAYMGEVFSCQGDPRLGESVGLEVTDGGWLVLSHGDYELDVDEYSEWVMEQLQPIYHEGASSNWGSRHRLLTALDITNTITLDTAQKMASELEPLPKPDRISLGVEDVTEEDAMAVLASLGVSSPVVKLDITRGQIGSLDAFLDEIRNAKLNGLRHLDIAVRSMISDGVHHGHRDTRAVRTDTPPLHPLLSFSISCPDIEYATLKIPNLFSLAHDLLRLFGPMCQVSFRPFRRSYRGSFGILQQTPPAGPRALLLTKALRRVMSRIVDKTRTTRAPGWRRICKNKGLGF